MEELRRKTGSEADSKEEDWENVDVVGDADDDFVVV